VSSGATPADVMRTARHHSWAMTDIYFQRMSGGDSITRKFTSFFEKKAD
jgi:hypothetical protein